ncbi:hypothetical protein [Vibrio mediterranei]|uniref:hypothetical protein n=1 Tax=Vibrio mediterranei TaxID=689 RepID=UPI002283B155|nr:hypothetical protein [Vibrio mediterranei]MCY9853357.1 hypothetical protein [Vibrio mediterranei]
MGLSLAIYNTVGETGIELATFSNACSESILAQWNAIPTANQVTPHYLVLVDDKDHVNSKFITQREVYQLLELWGNFDDFYAELPTGR